jgi:phage/plasmid-like protein (TIGR03299 family)
MAHDLTIRADGRAEMAFVGETPWHGLGQSVTKGASIGVWAKEAGMDWTAVEAPVYYHSDQGAGKPPMPMEADGYKMLYRSDTKTQLAIVGSGYEVVQPRAVLEFFRDLTEHDGWWIHTAGVLREGRKVWALASNGDVGSVGKKDKVVRNLLLATSLDGSMRTIATETAVRVVCANTLNYALSKTGGNKTVQVSHKTIFDPQLVKRLLGVEQDSFKLFMAKANEMAETSINIEEAKAMLRTIFKLDSAEAKKPSVNWLGKLASVTAPEPERENKGINTILALFEGAGMGADLKSAKGTRWGLLNAVTEYVDHDLGRTNDTRLDGAWFGRGASIKNEALQALMVTDHG